jgi:hypothetical protein
LESGTATVSRQQYTSTMIDPGKTNWLWQYAKELPAEGALSKQLETLALSLAEVRASYEDPGRKYSRMVGNRIQNASGDYWRAVDALGIRDFQKCKRLTRSSRLEVSFIKQLMEAENTEVELGEGEFFEFSDDQPLARKLDAFLHDEELELLSLAAEAKAHEK